jgi:curved DNA-binding protein
MLAGHFGPGDTVHAEAEMGDLYLEVAFREHPLYRVDGADIYLDLPVTPWEAALGSSIKAPTPAGASAASTLAHDSRPAYLELVETAQPSSN